MIQTKSTILNYLDTNIFGIEMAIIEFKNYQNMIENFLESEKNNLEKSYKDKIFKINECNNYSNDLLIQNLSEKHNDISRLFPHNFRASFLIQIVAFIDHELKEICVQYRKMKKIKYSLDDIKGNNDIDRAKEYLHKYCNIDFKNLNSEWSFIQIIKKIRNKLIHNQGFIKKTDKDWNQIINFNSKYNFFEFISYSISDESQKLIILNRDLNDVFLHITELFFKKLLQNELKINTIV